jgi:hypothetical protein
MPVWFIAATTANAIDKACGPKKSLALGLQKMPDNQSVFSDKGFILCNRFLVLDSMVVMPRSVSCGG